MQNHLSLDRETMVNIIRTDDVMNLREEEENASIEKTQRLDLELFQHLAKMTEKELLDCVIDALKRQSDSIL